MNYRGILARAQFWYRLYHLFNTINFISVLNNEKSHYVGAWPSPKSGPVQYQLSVD